MFPVRSDISITCRQGKLPCGLCFIHLHQRKDEMRRTFSMFEWFPLHLKVSSTQTNSPSGEVEKLSSLHMTHGYASSLSIFLFFFLPISAAHGYASTNSWTATCLIDFQLSLEWPSRPRTSSGAELHLEYWEIPFCCLPFKNSLHVDLKIFWCLRGFPDALLNDQINK